MMQKSDAIHEKLDRLIDKATTLEGENRLLDEKLKALELENAALKRELQKKEADLEAIIQRIEQISL